MNPLTTVRGSIAAGFVVALPVAPRTAPMQFAELGLARCFEPPTGGLPTRPLPRMDSESHGLTF